MMGKKIREFLKNKKAVGCAALAAVLIAGGVAIWQPAQEPDFPSYTDPVMEEVSIEEDETPLASTPKVTTKTTKKKSTKKVKLKKASKKTYTKKLPTTTKKKTSTKTSGDTTVTTETTIVTATTEKYTKKKKTKKVTKIVTTTVKTTTVTNTAETVDDAEAVEGVDNESVSSDTSASSNGTATSTAKTASTTQKYEVDVATIAPKMDSRVLSAYKTLGFTVIVNPSVTSYSGYFDAKSQTITLRSEDTTIYHELGHFLAFIANNYDRSSAFSCVYSSEKSLYTGINKVYVTQSASEYFAESVRDYITDPTSLQSSRPKTYAAVETALNAITDTQIARIQKIYGAYWN